LLTIFYFKHIYLKFSCPSLIYGGVGKCLTKRKWQNLSIFKKYISTPFCKKGLGQPAKPSLISGFKDGGGVIVQGHLQFTDITFMCMPAMLPMMKRGNEAIGSKVTSL
jgi:hypothetical protein